MTPDEHSEMDIPKLQQLAHVLENGNVDDTVRMDEKRPTPVENIATDCEFAKKDIEAPIVWENCDFETAISATGLYRIKKACA